MLRKFSIRSKLIICILVGCLVPYLIGGLYIKNKTEDWLYNNNIENANLLLHQAAVHVDEAILNNIQNLAAMITMDERVINVDSNINSYVDYAPDTFKYQYSQSEADILSYFASIKKSHEIITMVSFGTEEGGYIEYPNFKPISPYDPRIREWYKSTIHQNGTVISEPYITKVSGDLVFSLTKSVVRSGKNIGVICVTIKLDSLMEDINNLKYGRTGYINIISPKDVFINSPRNDKWLLNSVDAIDTEAFKHVDDYDGKSFDSQLDGVDKVFNVYISPYSGWKYISVIDKNEVLQHSKVLTDLLFIIYLITSLIILALMLIISNYITKPILNIAQVINKMATFKFDKYENKSFKSYEHQRDEIGEISRALSSMQGNFVELKNQIETMDEEIKNINIDEGSVYQLNLSKDNPFEGITKSINGLLEKVHSSIEQIRLYNNEISFKNELLITSEEELKSKLQEIDTQKELILYVAEHDPLTNLPNRRQFYEKLNRVLLAGGQGAVMLLDIDNFKGINDTLGHLFGDKVLQYVSAKLEEMPDYDIYIYRFGGDEFLLLYEVTEGVDKSVDFIKRLFELFNDKFQIDEIEVRIEISMGVSLFPKDSRDIDQLIMNADLALYYVKNRGKNNYAFFDTGMAEPLKFRLDTKNLLGEAITNDGFKMLYQPQVDLESGEIKGYEALIRLKDQKLSPGEFIPVAEEYGMIIDIGRIATKLVVEQMGRWQQGGYELKPVSINFSAVQMYDHEYNTYLLDLLKTHNIKPELIVIEITENIFLENKEAAISLFNELRSHGIKISIDDFGTGYSSLSYLTFLPIDSIKLDRALSIKFLEVENIAAMESLIDFAHSLNLKVIAEGIEEEIQVRRLVDGNCDAVQGYYFCKPLEAGDVEKNYDMIYKLP